MQATDWVANNEGISKENVEAAISTLRSGRSSTDLRGVPSELTEYGKSALKLLASSFPCLWKCPKPSEWKRNHKGRRNEPDNYRGLSANSTMIRQVTSRERKGRH